MTPIEELKRDFAHLICSPDVPAVVVKKMKIRLAAIASLEAALTAEQSAHLAAQRALVDCYNKRTGITEVVFRMCVEDHWHTFNNALYATRAAALAGKGGAE